MNTGDLPIPEHPFQHDHRMMLKTLYAAPYRIRDPRVLEAMARVPRHEFVPPHAQPYAYDDCALPLSRGQTISQPYIVAYMTEMLNLDPAARVLEIGTGSGYQSAVLAELASDVFSIEIVPELAAHAGETLTQLGYDHIHRLTGDGYAGWPDAAPFDAIIVTCAPDDVPPPLVDQLAEGGRMMIPVGDHYIQRLHLLQKYGDRLTEESVMAVRFVPMTGEASSD